MMDPSKLYNNWDFLMFLNQKNVDNGGSLSRLCNMLCTL
jgi:hypothetical protein